MGGGLARADKDKESDCDLLKSARQAHFAKLFGIALDPAREPTGCLACVCHMPCPQHSTEAVALAESLASGDHQTAIAILERNSKPERMAAFHNEYGSRLLSDLKGKLSSQDWARARVHLGAEVPFQEKVAAHDEKAVMLDIGKLSDEEALALFQTPAPVLGGAVAPPIGTFEAVEAAIRQKSNVFGAGGDRYYEAVSALLDKAERALVGVRAKQQALSFMTGLFGISFGTDPFPVDEQGLDAVSRARVDLAEKRFELLAKNVRAAGPQLLVVARLDKAERAALATRLAKGGGGVLTPAYQLAASGDSDIEVLRKAIELEGAEAKKQGRAVDQQGLSVAFERVGELVRSKRAERDRLAAAEAERANDPDAEPAAFDPFAPDPAMVIERELAELHDLFIVPRSDGVQRALESQNSEAYVKNLRTVGADSAIVGAAIVKQVRLFDTKALIAALEQLDPRDRLDALHRSERLSMLPMFPMSADEHELVRALIWEGRNGDRTLAPDPVAPHLPRGSAPITLGFEPWPDSKDGPSPESILALHFVTAGMKKGPNSAAEVLARLYQLTDDQRKALFADARYRAAFEAMPIGGDKSPERDFRQAMIDAESGRLEEALHNFPGPAGPWQHVKLEDFRIQAEQLGRARLRRAYVLQQQIDEDPGVAARLTGFDQQSVKRLAEMRAEAKSFDTQDLRDAASEIILGQPQLADTEKEVLDANAEVDYMRARLRTEAQLGSGKRLTDWNHDAPRVIEALTSFEVLYNRARNGGVSRVELAKLAVLFYDAQDALKRYKIDKAANEQSAASIAQLVGMIVATVVVTVASGGTLGPFAIGALAAVSAGAASTVAGALVRDEDDWSTYLRDFGTGAVEGALAVAGEGLAARAVARLTAGMPAARAAAVAGEAATAKAATSFGAKVVKTAIEGAVGGAGGSLFQSATDAATWEQGIARAFARMIVATAKGAAMGAGVGAGVSSTLGGLGKIWKRFGADSAKNVGRLLDAAGVESAVLDELGEAAHADLVKAVKHIEAGELNAAERALARVEGLAPKSREALLEVARGKALIEAARGAGRDLRDQNLWPHVIKKRQLPKMPGGKRPHAMVVIEGGEIKIATHGRAPAESLYEEFEHVQQFYSDSAMRSRMENLSEEALKDYKKFSPMDKIRRHIDAAEVEADVQRRLIAQLEDAAEHDPRQAMRLADAEEALVHAEDRIAKLRGAKVGDLASLDIESVPRLFSSTAHTRAGRMVVSSEATEVRYIILQEGKLTDPKVRARLRKLGYRVSDDPAKMARIVREEAKASKLPHLRVNDDFTFYEVTSTQRPNFKMREAGAEQAWKSTLTKLEDVNFNMATAKTQAEKELADLTKKKLGPQFLAALKRRVDSGELDPTKAGLLAKWGGVVDQLRSHFKVDIDTLLDDFLNDKGAKLTADDIATFRRDLRTLLGDKVAKIDDGAKRSLRLYELLSISPESASLGHQFGEFRMSMFERDEMKEFFKAAREKPLKVTGPGQTKERTPDDVIDVLKSDAEQTIPIGKYYGEDKAGKGAFDIEQMEDIMKRWDDDAGVIRNLNPDEKTLYNGEIVFSARHSEAEAAYAEMESRPHLSSLLNRNPPAIFVMYLDEATGLFKRYLP